MSGHQEYKCHKCGYEWETLDAPNCPACSSFAAPAGYAAWFNEVLRFAKEKLDWSPRALASIDAEAWKEYFDEGLTPAEAWQEEYDAAA